MSRIKKILLGIFALLVAFSGYYFMAHRGAGYQFVSVSRGLIVQTVSVTGNTVPRYSVSLGFGNSGIVSAIYSAVGERVSAGALLAVLDTGDLDAQLKQAEGNVEAQTAKLLGLQAGSRPEEIASSAAALQKGEQDLANMYAGISDVSADSYAKAVDAVRTQLNPFFVDGDSGHPALSYYVSDPQEKINAEGDRVPAGTVLNNWRAELESFGASSTRQELEQSLNDDLSRMAVIKSLADNVSKTLESATSLSASTLATYQTDVGAAITEINAAIKNLNAESQNIASQKLVAAGLKAELDLKQAGSTAEDIIAQGAEVKQAEAGVESIRAKIRNSQIFAPQGGVITQFDAKVGQIASPPTPLISIISDNSFEVDAIVPETDIGKIILNDKVTMTLDAFPGENFSGSVFYIDPAQTNSAGVIGYKIKIGFDKPDARMKSGLTANLEIETKKKEDVLILPQYAILQTDQGTFIETLRNGLVNEVPVTLGIQDQKGNVEILSGVSEAEQVLNIGLKKI